MGGQDGTLADAARVYLGGITAPQELGLPDRVAFTSDAVKTLYLDSGVMVVQSNSVVIGSSEDMEEFAARFADAPTPQHPTRVTVVMLEKSGVVALVLDPVLESGTSPSKARSAIFVVRGQQYSLFLDTFRTEAECLIFADMVAVAAARGT